ncbi:MAG: hypothetical protein A2Y38_09170 [Spirochaetes bacterium GWB1_59_5]|nr:MAG: hypothetical protein A2Y38_09170 [Spirochaetes bacterium GWB1_59_5]
MNLDNAAVLSNDTVDGLKAITESIIDGVHAAMNALGLPEYPRPRSTPRPLDDAGVAGLSNPDLGQLYVEYVAYAQYVNGQLAELEAGYRIAVANLKQLDAKLKSQLFAAGTAKAEIPALVKDNPVYLEFELEVLKLYAMKSIVDAHYRAYDKQAAGLSRVITLREMEFQQELRGAGIGGMRKGRARPGIGLDGKPI